MVLAVTGLRCRQIEKTDIDAVATLLAQGFPSRTRQFWLHAFAQLTAPSRRPDRRNMVTCWTAAAPWSAPFCSSARPCGRAAPSPPAAIFPAGTSNHRSAPMRRSWVSQALRHKDVTYLNVSPAPHTQPIIEAQGFSRYCDGIFIAMPMLQGLFGGPAVELFDAQRRPAVALILPTGRCCSSTPCTAVSACGAPRANAPIPSCSALAWSRSACPARS